MLTVYFAVASWLSIRAVLCRQRAQRERETKSSKETVSATTLGECQPRTINKLEYFALVLFHVESTFVWIIDVSSHRAVAWIWLGRGCRCESAVTDLTSMAAGDDVDGAGEHALHVCAACTLPVFW